MCEPCNIVNDKWKDALVMMYNIQEYLCIYFYEQGFDILFSFDSFLWISMKLLCHLVWMTLDKST
jgi:hypothetical protein